VSKEQPLVIYVDDSPVARELVSDALGKVGYRVLTAENVADLERTFNRDASLTREVSLFILDFDMPEMTGPQIAAVLDRLHQDLRESPFLIYSAKDSEEVENGLRQAEDLSFTFVRNYRGFVQKREASVEGLVDRVRELLPLD
jgi:CheY-like chemotaxis protein